MLTFSDIKKTYISIEAHCMYFIYFYISCILWYICVFCVFYKIGVRNFQAQRAIDKHWSMVHTLCAFYVLLYILCIRYISCIFCVVMYFEDLVRFVLELFKHRETIEKIEATGPTIIVLVIHQQPITQFKDMIAIEYRFLFI